MPPAKRFTQNTEVTVFYQIEFLLPGLPEIGLLFTNNAISMMLSLHSLNKNFTL